ncbi:hypothetical protein AVEN_98123-1 [Araneus ventricosus]|uniref:Uncharacterized protein n=1 Tax=Araneus ventricosus TaxID=182803 RepID=A0A4Y2NUM7_ARAVE|nr:hypothetical protein AVEN_98123-1 [Araneus ventricosus]
MNFYSTDEISYQTTDRAGCMVFRENGQKLTKQETYLSCTLIEAFKQLHPTTEIVNWNFLATIHDKWAVDGVRGTVKRVVCRGIMLEKWIPSRNDARSFAKSANSICNGVEVICCPKDDNKRDIAV